MNRCVRLILPCTGVVALLACGTERQPDHQPQNTLTETEQAAGWQLLFDGQTFDGWRGLGRDSIPTEHWTIENGSIRKVASGEVATAPDGQPLEGGDIMTAGTYRDFELTFDWKVSPGANSGVKYNVSEEMSTASPPGYAALGFEYQVLDDELHPDAQNGPTRIASALYDLVPPGSARQLGPVAHGSRQAVFKQGSLQVALLLVRPCRSQPGPGIVVVAADPRQTLSYPRLSGATRHTEDG